MIDFDFSLDEQDRIQNLAFEYRNEAEKCQSAGAYLSGCILMGSALEALLLTTINCFPQLVLKAKSVPKKNGKIKHFAEWGLADLIKVANELTLLPSGLSPNDDWNTANAQIGDYTDIIRQIRNLVHPGRYLKELGWEKIPKEYLEACFNIVDAASEYLSKVIESSHTMLLDEQEKRKNKKSRPQ